MAGEPDALGREPIQVRCDCMRMPRSPEVVRSELIQGYEEHVGAHAVDGFQATTLVLMSDVQIFHNPNCSTSKFAVGVADELGVDYDTVKYMLKSERPSLADLSAVADVLEDPVTDMVRRDANFEKLGLSEDDVVNREQVLSVLAEHPELLQRPILVKGGRAIIGRPKDRIAAFLKS